MKRILLVVVFTCAIITSLFAGNDKNIVSSTLKSATVYRSGAELQHTAKGILSQGNNELVIDGISNKVDMNSLRIGISGNVTILSSEFSTDFLKPAQKSALIWKLEDSLESVNKELEKIQVVLKTDKELLDLLKSNKEIKGTQSGLSVAELVKMMDYYKAKTLELQNEISVYRDKEIKTLDLSSKIQLQIKEEEQKNTKTVGKLSLQLFCPMAGSYDFTVTYLTPGAFWNPAYDVRVDNISKPVALSYKAKLVQTTGIDWHQVKLTLATSIPNQNSNAPEIQSWFLGYINPFERDKKEGDLSSALQGKVYGVMVNSGYSESFDEIRVRGTGSLTANSEPVYVIDGKVVDKLAFQNINPNTIKAISTLKGRQATSIYGSRAENGAIVVTLKGGIEDYISVKDNTMNVTFDIELPYDVPSNGKEQNVTLQELTVPAIYQYYAAPKLDKDAYLLGEVPEWESLNLLAGNANIIVEGTYIGKSMIDPNSTKDTMNLTLGKDKRVVVKREKLVDYSSIKFLGSNKKQTYTYELTVKNNKKEKIQMILKDQYPLSTNKDIEVELLQSDGAAVNSETGILTWKLELAPGESKKIRISYSAKYPKDKILNL